VLNDPKGISRGRALGLRVALRVWIAATGSPGRDAFVAGRFSFVAFDATDSEAIVSFSASVSE
jgi:hypothetical protein